LAYPHTIIIANRARNREIKNQISELTQTIEKLNALVMEQVKVIYEWVVGR